MLVVAHRRSLASLTSSLSQREVGTSELFFFPAEKRRCSGTCVGIQIMAPRWKGKDAEAAALAEPMSILVSQLQSSLLESNSQGLLVGCTVLLLAAHPEQTNLFIRTTFGHPRKTAEKDNKQWFNLSLEEALYLCVVMKCIKIVGIGKRPLDDQELWSYTTSKRVGFPILFKAYCHLRSKNWVMRAGSQYGVDFVAYRHHPSLVHSEYSVLALPDDGECTNDRLKVWSDFHCTLRLCGSVAKTLLVLRVSKRGKDVISLSSLEHCYVEEVIVPRWNPELSRQNQAMMVEKDLCKSRT
ncbi:hypothetical protein ACS0TY_020434 [Phlomoides rotata]